MPIDKDVLDQKLQKALGDRVPKEPEGYPAPHTVEQIKAGAQVYEEAGKIEASLGVQSEKKNSV